MNQLRFFNPYGEIRQTENRLPHWQQIGAVYFTTVRLGDSIPRHLHSRWEYERANWLRYNPEPWSMNIEREYHERFSAQIESWLDAGYGSCLLRKPDCAKIVADTFRFFDGIRVSMISFVVMPNHAHALFVQNPEWLLEKLLQSWKRYSCREINKLLNRSGSLWLKDYFDRLVRDNVHFANCIRYIRHNPRKAKLCPGEYILYESEIACRIPDRSRGI